MKQFGVTMSRAVSYHYLVDHSRSGNSAYQVRIYVIINQLFDHIEFRRYEMNKQEVLEELETTSTQFFHVATSTGVEANNKTLSTGVFAGLGIAKSVLTKLEEPQKVIAQLSEKWHEDIGPVLWWDFPVEEPPYCGTPLDDDFPKYKTHFTELHIPDEVEEEPKWVVKVGNLYFCGWEDTTAQFVMNTVLGEDESIIKYKNEGTASSVAKNLGGTVEKV